MKLLSLLNQYLVSSLEWEEVPALLAVIVLMHLVLEIAGNTIEQLQQFLLLIYAVPALWLCTLSIRINRSQQSEAEKGLESYYLFLRGGVFFIGTSIVFVAFLN